MYGSLPTTGIAALTVGSVAVARPILAASVAVLLIALGGVLRVTGKRKAIVS